MSRFQVSAPGIRPATVEAGNWLAALGLGLDKLGLDADFNRLACEVLPNGTVIAQDVRSGNRFVVRPEADEQEKPSAVSTPRSGSSGGFRDASTPESGYAADRGAPSPEDVDTVVPEDFDEDEQFEAGSDDDEVDGEAPGLALDDLEPEAEEPLPIDPAEFPDATDEEAVDADSATASGNEGLLVEHTDEDVAEIDSRMVEPLPPELYEPDAGTSAEDEDEQEVLELLETIRHARTDILAWQVALSVAMQLVPSEAGSALQRDPNGSVQFVGTEGPGSHVLRGVRLPQGIGIIGFCMDRRASIIVHDPKNDPRFYRDMDDATGFATRAVLCVPVALETEVFGCLELMNPPIGQSFTRVHIELVEMVAFTLADALVTGRSP